MLSAAPATRQVAVPSPSEHTQEMGLSEANEQDYLHPNPEQQKLSGLTRRHVVTEPANTVRVNVSDELESTETEVRDSEDSFIRKPLSTRAEQSARGRSAATQGSRSAGDLTRAGPATPPNALPSVPPETGALEQVSGNLRFSSNSEKQAESTVREEGDRLAVKASAAEPVTRQVAVPSPSEYTQRMELPEANDRDYLHPNPEQRELSGLTRRHVVTEPANTVRVNVSDELESTETEVRNSEDSFIRKPLSTRAEQSARGISAATQGSRSAGDLTRAGSATPPPFWGPSRETLEVAIVEAYHRGQNQISGPRSSIPGADQGQGRAEVNLGRAAPPAPKVQIGLIEVFVMTPESAPAKTSRRGDQSPTTLASRHYLRNL